jgi:sigma-E factor negative regulatory protein RseC
MKMRVSDSNVSPGSIDQNSRSVIEGVAHVVSVEGGLAYLEPEQTSGCGGCASSAVCGEKGIGTLASRLEMRRFTVANTLSLAVGERVVLGVKPHSLIAASALAYFVPLVVSLLSAALVQWKYGNDLLCLATMIAGLFAGFALTWLFAARFERKNENELLILGRVGSIPVRPMTGERYA